MNVITVPSPVVKLNVAANCLLLVTKDCVLRLYSLEMIKPNVYVDHGKGERKNWSDKIYQMINIIPEGSA